jgi:ornithine decarboxylase
MPRSYPKLAVAPLGRRFESRQPLPTVDAAVLAERPAEPLHCLRPATIAATARLFTGRFPGDVLYAVKCNPEPRVLRALWAGGIRHFDCASLAEVQLVRQMFETAAIHFMHPVKARPAVREAHARFGVDDFVFDSADELAKILAETGAAARPAPRLGLFVRLAVAGPGARHDLSGKFGCDAAAAAALLRAARPHARRLGLAFHVGSQNLDPADWRRAIVAAGRVARAAGVGLDVLDVGGGFPVAYPDMQPEPLAAYLDAVTAGVAEAGLGGVRLWTEPGRALVAAGASVVIQVQLRRGDDLYVNDGIYGSLADAGAMGFRFPCRLLPADGRIPAAGRRGFRLFGPTCDSSDRMQGPFLLPDDVAEGDWIEVGQLGAYGQALRTAFNGFDRARLTEVSDPPLLATPGHDLPRPSAAARRRPRTRLLRGASAR